MLPFASGNAGVSLGVRFYVAHAATPLLRWGDAATARYAGGDAGLGTATLGGRCHAGETLPRLCYAGEMLGDAGPRGERGGRLACYAAGVVRFSAVTPRTSHLSSGLVKCRIPSGCLPYTAGSEPFSRVSWSKGRLLIGLSQSR